MSSKKYPQNNCRTLHHYHQAIAPDFGCPGKPDAEAWTNIATGKESFVAAARLTLLELTSIAAEREDTGGISQSRVRRNGAADKGMRPQLRL